MCSYAVQTVKNSHDSDDKRKHTVQFSNENSPCHREDATKGPTIVNSYAELLDMTANKECKYSMALGSMHLHASLGKYCGVLVQAGEEFFEGGPAFILPRGSDYTRTMTEATEQLRIHGLLPKLEDFYHGRQKCESNNSPKITFRKLHVFFFVIYGACFLLFMEMVLDPQTSVKHPVKAERRAPTPRKQTSFREETPKCLSTDSAFSCSMDITD